MSNNTNEPTIEEIKQSLDILEIAKLYGELVKTGANYKYKNNPSIVINPSKQIFSDFNGNITGGSVLDLVMYMENKDLKAGIERLKELSSLETYIIDPALQIKRKEESKKAKIVNFEQLNNWGKEELKNVGSHKPVESFKDNELTHFIVTEDFSKLFETKTLPAIYNKKIDYLFNNLLGWNKHFNCPSIIIRDHTNKIVDLIAYRPNKPQSYDSWSNPKYLYKNSHNRGAGFLYPFRKEVESILWREKYLIVGEGIKNGLNALLYSVPFIPVESTSNGVSDELIAYILDYHSKGYDIIGMYDGDKAGREAFEKFKQQLGLEINNFLDFDSGIDFVDYLQKDEGDK